MKLFKCPNCGQLLTFENTHCERCGHRLGYIAEADQLAALEPDGDIWRCVAEPDARYRFCANAEDDVCNWLVPAESDAMFCVACRHNRTIPDLSDAGALVAWRKIEIAKHRLFYTICGSACRIRPRRGAGAARLRFPRRCAGGGRPESDDRPRRRPDHDRARRGRRRRARAPARPDGRALPDDPRPFPPRGRAFLLGHPGARRRLAGPLPRRFRRRARRLRRGAAAPLRERARRPNWQDRHVSAYATAHPWEDFAETWAHYLHIVDSLEMARALPWACIRAWTRPAALAATAEIDPYGPSDIEALVGDLGSARLRDERRQSLHGAERPLSLHPVARGDRQARLRA